MKKLSFLALLTVVIYACSNQSNSETDNSNNDTEKQTDCEDKKSAEDFNSFLGVDYGDSELSLEKTLGSFTGGEYTADSAAFIYYFKSLPGAPLSVWVNSASQKVETVFLEILGYDELFESDLNEAITRFKISPCESQFYGMKHDEILKIMGEPRSNDITKEGVRSITYDSEDYTVSVMFKFYPEQDNKCSSISVNWFY